MSNSGAGYVSTVVNSTLSEGVNLIFGTTTGTKLGTATTQKLGFYNTTPVIQPAGTVDVLASLVTLGLRAASSNPPLDLGTGTLTAGLVNISNTVTLANAKFYEMTATSGNSARVGCATTTLQIRTGTGGMQILNNANAVSILLLSNTGVLTLVDAGDIVLGSTTGSKIGTATTQKLGFFNTTPIVQPTAVTPVATTASGLASFGYTQAQADAIPVAINAIISRLSTAGSGLGLFA